MYLTISQNKIILPNAGQRQRKGQDAAVRQDRMGIAGSTEVKMLAMGLILILNGEINI